MYHKFQSGNVDVKDIVNRIIGIVMFCGRLSVEEVMVSYILVKGNLNLTKIIRQVNDLFSEMFIANSFHHVCNDNVAREYL